MITHNDTQLGILAQATQAASESRPILPVTHHPFLSQLLLNPYVLILVLNREGKIVDFSTGCVALSGYTVAEVRGSPVTRWLQADHIQRLLDQLPRSPLPLQFDAPLLTKDGRQVMVRWVFDDGDEQHLVLLGTDVSDYYNHIFDLHKREQRYRTIVQDQTEMICRYTPEYVLTFVNDAYCRYFGKTCAELIGQSFLPLIHPDDHYRALAYLSTLSPERPTASVEHRVVLPDGSIGWHQWVDRAIFDEQGRLVEFQAVGRDITARKQAEEALRESENRFRQITENLDDIFFIRDVINRQMLYISPAYERVWQRPSQPLYEDATRFLDYVHPDDYARMSTAVDLTDQGIPLDETYRSMANDGSIRWVHVRSFPIYDEHGRIYRVVGFANDITARKHQETEREQLIQDLRAFGHTVAHDLKNPVNIVLNSAAIVQQITPPDAESQRFIGHIVEKGRTMHRIINALLLLGGVRDAEIEPEALEMPSLLQRVVQRLQPDIERYNATLEIKDGVWQSVWGYGVWVEEIWANYLLNALHYGGSPPYIELGAEIDPINPDHIRFYVQDHGHGLSHAEAVRLFTPFTRLNEQSLGHGLGLAIVKRIIEKLGGRVGVVSEVGVGSKFTFSLPATPAIVPHPPHN